MKRIDVLKCTHEAWYQTFKNVTFESESIELSSEFIDYLLADGVVLPERANQPVDRSNLEGDSDDEVDWESGEAQEAAVPSFPALDAAIGAALERLGGRVLPKLNWSAPKDASWITLDGSLCCQEPNDIYLLLKSSDFITHDLTQPFKHCEDCEAAAADDITYRLTLRRWHDLNVGMEFRCFVKDNAISGISQRHHTCYFKFLQDQHEQIVRKICNFYERKIRAKFPADDYVFDVYIDGERVYLMDFNPFGATTDALLFSWSELRDERPEASEWPELRYCREDALVQGNAYQQFSVPKDFVDLANGEDPDKLLDLLHMKIQSQNEDTSDGESIGG